jgi:glycosyltransferase involved in cell wall biosynthesis
MISVLTLTYQRPHILEEAIQSFLLQNKKNSEMVIINDSPNSHYVFDHPQVKVFNIKERFSSISKKLEFGFRQCKYDYIYRLDDDDLLGPDALDISEKFILENPGFEIYRPKTHYFFLHNKFEKISGNVNNGNVYSKKYINRITFPDSSFGEDFDITYKTSAKIFESNDKITMIYRWGMSTYHVSGMGNIDTKLMYEKVDTMTRHSTGNLELQPKFLNNYYQQILEKTPL